MRRATGDREGRAREPKDLFAVRRCDLEELDAIAVECGSFQSTPKQYDITMLKKVEG